MDDLLLEVAFGSFEQQLMICSRNAHQFLMFFSFYELCSRPVELVCLSYAFFVGDITKSNNGRTKLRQKTNKT